MGSQKNFGTPKVKKNIRCKLFRPEAIIQQGGDICRELFSAEETYTVNSAFFNKPALENL